MSGYETRNANPLGCIDTSFRHYVAKKKMSEEKHMVNGVPDYAFALDYEMRSKIMQIPHFYSISKKIVETQVTLHLQQINQDGVAAGPSQFAEIYSMGVECAKTLGIGTPNIYIVNNPQINAYTIATDDVSPLIVLNSGIVERMSDGELKAVIAHECGHIHNNHGVLQYVVQVLLGSAGKLGFVISVANILLMQMWTRAQEITADRAACICADNIQDVHGMHEKILYGGILGKTYQLDYAALRAQLDMTLDNPSRILEILKDHPSTLRRIFAGMLFEECETFFAWRPELRNPDISVISRQEADDKCRKLVNIMDNK